MRSVYVLCNIQKIFEAYEVRNRTWFCNSNRAAILKRNKISTYNFSNLKLTFKIMKTATCFLHLIRPYILTPPAAETIKLLEKVKT